MKEILKEFKNPEAAKRIIEAVRTKKGPKVKVMEVCGTHTMAISRLAIRELLADRLEFRSGPGCPVCVTAAQDIDTMIAYTGIPGLITATFGDMLRVPGSGSSLMQEKAKGADVRVVYSPLEAVRLAENNPHREVVFLGVGFETTVPAIALALEQAAKRGTDNFFLHSCHKLTPPAVEALLRDDSHDISGFLCPGHVSAVIGRKSWDFLSEKYGLPAVVAGFEAVDILAAVYRLLEMLARGERRVVNGYTRVVREEGNLQAVRLIDKYFQTETAEWRGLGTIPESGLALRDGYRAFDARCRFAIDVPRAAPVKGCRCGEVLKGKIVPPDCALFGRACTPEEPVGPCMVSGEGACAAYYKFERRPE